MRDQRGKPEGYARKLVTAVKRARIYASGRIPPPLQASEEFASHPVAKRRGALGRFAVWILAAPLWAQVSVILIVAALAAGLGRVWPSGPLVVFAVVILPGFVVGMFVAAQIVAVVFESPDDLLDHRDDGPSLRREATMSVLLFPAFVFLTWETPLLLLLVVTSGAAAAVSIAKRWRALSRRPPPDPRDSG